MFQKDAIARNKVPYWTGGMLRTEMSTSAFPKVMSLSARLLGTMFA